MYSLPNLFFHLKELDISKHFAQEDQPESDDFVPVMALLIL